MKLHNTFLLLLSFFSCHFSCNTEAANNNEVSTLLSIKSSILDPFDHLKEWKLPANDPCIWKGVQCNSNSLIQSLDLSNMNLSGKISDEITQLSSLAYLNLSCNEFSSPLPTSLSKLTGLKMIDLSQNQFPDHLPDGLLSSELISFNASGNNLSSFLPDDLSNAEALESLDLRGNFFQGSIPGSFKRMKRLKFLGLSGNNLTGELPRELGEMESIETMILGYNFFQGGIPEELGNLTSLKYLDIAFANLSGSIPAELGKLKKLTTLFLYQNSLGGNIPPQVCNLTALEFLDLSENMLSGEIPADVGELRKMRLLNLMSNHLSGSIPSSIAILEHLEVLELWNNTFSGFLPSDLGRYSTLTWLDLSSNVISGPIPTSLCNGGNLSKLILFNNAFSGPIPDTLSNCSSLVRVRMQNNRLSGTIPVGFGKLSQLQRLEFANNTLTGQIPTDLSASTSLAFIDISKNNIESSLPSSILSMPNLQSFIASGNSLLGNIPDQFQYCPSLSVLDISSNHFTGNIPLSIASCERLVTLNLRSNELTGPIPKALAMMPTLSVLDLSNNSLTGGIPDNFGNSPALESLNVSYNKLVGPVPINGMLRTINPDDLVGNAGLCGGVLHPCSDHNAESTSQKQRMHGRHIIGGWLLGFFTLVAIVVTGLGGRYMCLRWRDAICVEQTSKGEWPWRLMAFQKLAFNSNDIVPCIKESNVIGMGATGTVYRVDIQRLNTTVAVKKLWRSRSDLEMGDSGSLVGEVNLLSKLRHRNIVRLFGFLHNDSEAMIIYEFMKNGNLGEALHSKEMGPFLVDWVSRYNIAVGVAQGLAYLHHDCHPPVIHRDVKSTNILLDENLESRVADFGLAKMMIHKNETVSMVAGSYGYIAPEYGYTSKVDEKSDVYSYGVVLMELLTGKMPVEAEFGESVDVVEWIRRKMRDGMPLEESLDSSVGSTRYVQEEMLVVLRIAILCTAKLPKDRPSMRDVLTMLGEAKPRRKSGCSVTSNKDKPVFTTISECIS